ncbi:hypothetical protein [Nocardioides dilutus]
MWTWVAGAASIVVAATVGWFVQQILSRGIRWRALTLAGHELDVAAKLSDDDPQGEALRQRAATRLEKYLRETTEDASTVRRDSWRLLGLCLAAASLLLPSILLDTGAANWATWVGWVSLVPVALIALVAIWTLVMTRPSPAPRRPADGTPPAPPEQPEPAARPSTSGDPAPHAPPPPAKPQPAPPT